MSKDLKQLEQLVKDIEDARNRVNNIGGYLGIKGGRTRQIKGMTQGGSQLGIGHTRIYSRKEREPVLKGGAYMGSEADQVGETHGRAGFQMPVKEKNKRLAGAGECSCMDGGMLGGINFSGGMLSGGMDFADGGMLGGKRGQKKKMEEPKTTKRKAPAHLAEWHKLVKQVQAQNPELTYKDALKVASQYKK